MTVWFQSLVMPAMIFLLALLMGCAPQAAVLPGSTIELQNPVQPVSVGTLVSVPVFLRQTSDLVAFEIHLAFDPALLEVTELRNGGLVADDFVVQNSFDNTAGTIDYAIAQLNGQPANEDGILLVIVFRTHSTGLAMVTFRPLPSSPAGILLSDGDGQSIAVQTLSAANFTIR